MSPAKARSVRLAVLADTGPLYAAVDPSDAHHGRARAELDRLGDGGLGVVIAFPIMLESYTLILRRLGHAAASTFVADSIASGLPLNPEPADYVAAAARVRALPDQQLTLFDGVLAQLSDRLSLPTWTFDHHFDVLGVAVWR